MNFQQLRYVRAAVQNNLNLSKVASSLFTSQPGVSKQIKDLELELGVEIFQRRGKRLISVTQAGEKVLAVIEDLLTSADNLKRLSEQFKQQDRGRLVIAATHNQACYILPQILLRFTRMFPDVTVELRQGTPDYVVNGLLQGTADIGLATEALDTFAELETYPCFFWEHVVVVRQDHPLNLRAKKRGGRIQDITLADLARYPIITYNADFAGRSKIDAAFRREGLTPDIRLAAMDADVIKTYVRYGMGVGIVAEMAMSHNPPGDRLVSLPASRSFFEPSVTKIAFLRGTLLRNFAYHLIELAAPHLDHAVLNGTLRRPSPGHPHKVLHYSQRSDLIPEGGDAAPFS